MSYKKSHRREIIGGTSLVLSFAALCAIIGIRSEVHSINTEDKKVDTPKYSDELHLSAAENPLNKTYFDLAPDRMVNKAYLDLSTNRIVEFYHEPCYKNIENKFIIEEGTTDENITLEHIPTYEEKLASFLEYSNIKDEETFNRFANFFINYSNNENLKTVEDVLNMLYEVSQVSMEEKLEKALTFYGLGDEDNNYKFRVVEAICETEATPYENGRYEDSYGVISTLYNRIHSKDMIRYVNYVMNTNTATNMYTQAIATNQFEVYSNGMYLKAMGNVNTICYKAMLDMLYLEIPVHDRLGFLSSNNHTNGSIQLVSGGNNYNTPMNENDYTDEFERQYEQMHKDDIEIKEDIEIKKEPKKLMLVK